MNSYYKTLGQAYSALVSAFTGNDQLTYISSGFSITWNSSSGADGGYFAVAGATSAGPAYANGNYYAQEARTGAGLPLAYVMREQGMGDAPQITSLTTAGELSFASLMSYLHSSRSDAIVDVTGASLADLHTYNATVTGGSQAVGSFSASVYTTAYEVAVDVSWGIDKAGQPANAPITMPIIPLYETISGFAVIPQVVLPNPIPDLEVAINNGGSIYSISSNTFTEP